MRQSFWASVALCFVVSGCQQSQPVLPAATTAANVKSSDAAAEEEVVMSGEDVAAHAGDFIIGEPIRFENLVLFPICTRVVKNDDRFITLDEGLKAGTVEVMELGARPEANAVANAPADDPFSDVVGGNLVGENLVGNVNRVHVLNRSDKPLYLMPGEIIVGGKQDRCIGSETIVEANAQPASVEVYCVEHGRWHRRDTAEFAFLASALVADVSGESIAELSQKAASGKFVASAGNLSKKARYSAQSGEGQRRVWEEVGFANSANGVAMASDAFTGNYAQKDVREKLDPYIEHLQASVAEIENVVGVVVAINGKVEMTDVYESTPLFQKLWPKLLKGYALDAIAVATDKTASDICDVDRAREFFDKAREAGVDKTDEKGGLVVTARSSPDVTSFSADVAGGMGGGFGGAVHSAGYGR